MKKLIFVLLILPFFVSAQKTDTQLKTLFDQIKNETQPGANTGSRVANALQQLADARLPVISGTLGGGTTAYTFTAPINVISYIKGQAFYLQVNAANTGSSTLNITPSGGSALGAKTIKKSVSTNLSSGDLVLNHYYWFVYDGTNFQVDLGGGGGSSTFVGLSDGPGAFTGQSLKTVRVNAGETALEYITAGTGTVTNIATSNGITGGAITTTGTISGVNSIADGSTKGVASFTAADFNSSSGNISLDYTNGQAASGSVNGFLSSTDWTTFNGKVSTSRTISTTAPLTGGGDLSANRTFAITQSNGSTNGYLSSTDWNTFNSKQATIADGYGTTIRGGNKVDLGGYTHGNPNILVGLGSGGVSGHDGSLAIGDSLFNSAIIVNKNFDGTSNLLITNVNKDDPSENVNLFFDLDNSTGYGHGVYFLDARAAKKGIEYHDLTYTDYTDSTLVPKGWVLAQGYSTGAGAGTVTSFSAGNLSPLFTTSVATATSTPALTFALSNASANTWFGNNTGGSTTPSFNGAGALSKTDDTNVTLTLSGAPTTALLNSTGITVGWTGTLSKARGGTANANGTADIAGGTLGAVPYQSAANTTTLLAANATANKMLLSGASAAPTWSTSTIPTSAGATANKVLLSDGTNYVLSTPTFPNASATSGKTIRSDGTNWIASTATLSDAPSTALKWLRSDGTNWITSTSTLAEGGVTAGKHLKSDGTNWVATTATISDAPSTALKWLRSDGTNWITSTSTLAEGGVTSGKILVSDGTNWVASTPTFPNASATSGKIIKSDGTNWTASTETYASPGTSGNLLTSDGTNWLSSAPTFWSLASGGTLTASNTITNNTPNGLNYTGTFTATANNQFFESHTTSSTITTRATASDLFDYASFTPSITAGSTAQILSAVKINATFATTNSPTNNQLTIFSATNTDAPLAIYTAAGAAKLYFFNSSGSLQIGSNATANFSSQNNGSIGSTGRGPSLAGTINSSNNTAILLTHNSGGTLTDGTTANKKFLDTGFNWAASSGGVAPTLINLQNTINATGTFSATTPYRGIRFNPTETSLTGLTGNYYFLTSSSTKALSGIGTETPTAMWTVNGSESSKVNTQTANYTVVSGADGDYLIRCTTNSFTVTLPTAVGITGTKFIIKNTNAGKTITLATTSSQNIDGAAPGTIVGIGVTRVVSNGTDWDTW